MPDSKTSDFKTPDDFMGLALAQAQQAEEEGEVPVGAVIVCGRRVIATAGNRMRKDGVSWHHAEILALRQAHNLKGMYLEDCAIYVTLEPCVMCAAVLAFARMGAIFFGAYDLKRGGIEHGPRLFDEGTSFYKPLVFGGFREQECQHMLRLFFQQKRGMVLETVG